MDERMVEDSEAVVDDADQFQKSLKELREFSSQLYHAADYCKTVFLTSSDKTRILETTKAYVSHAVVVVVDHLGTMSANLECCISESDSVSETEHKIDCLKQRIGTCKNHSYKVSLPRFHWGSDFSRYNCRYISLLSKDSKVSGSVSSYPKICIDAKNEEGNLFEAVELLHSDAYIFKPSLVESSSSGIMRKNALTSVEGNQPILPKIKNTVFHFQEAEKINKRGTINCKLMMQTTDIAALIKRGKRLLA